MLLFVPDDEALGFAKVVSDGHLIAFVIIRWSESLHKFVACIEPNIGGFWNEERSRVVCLNVRRWSSFNINTDVKACFVDEILNESWIEPSFLDFNICG
jgi:hypothetical protein